MVGEGRNGHQRQGGSSQEHSTDAAQYQVRAISIGFEAQLAAQLAQPEDGFDRPVFDEQENDLGSSQDECKQTTHALDGPDPQVFDIQTLLLVKAIAVFDLAAQTPVAVDLDGVRFGAYGDIGEQDCIPIFEVIMGHKNPQRLVSAG